MLLATTTHCNGFTAMAREGTKWRDKGQRNGREINKLPGTFDNPGRETED